MSGVIAILVDSFGLREGYHQVDERGHTVFKSVFGTVVVTNFTSINPSYRVLMSSRELL